MLTPVPNNNIADATPAQAQRLAQIKSRPTTESVQLLNLNTAALHSNSARLVVSGNETLTFERRNLDALNDKDFTWSGVLPGVEGEATIVVHDGNATGSVRNNRDLYRIEPVGNGVQALVKVNQGGFPPEHPPSFEEKERRGDVGPVAPSSANDEKNGPTEITVLVAYTPAAAKAVARYQRDRTTRSS